MEHFPNARYIDAYGMTETCSGDTLMDEERELEKIGSVGRAVRFVEIEIRNDLGERLPAGQEDEICMRGPKVMKEYWRDPQTTAATFHADGFMRSGDFGYPRRAGIWWAATAYRRLHQRRPDQPDNRHWFWRCAGAWD